MHLVNRSFIFPPIVFYLDTNACSKYSAPGSFQGYYAGQFPFEYKNTLL